MFKVAKVIPIQKGRQTWQQKVQTNLNSASNFTRIRKTCESVFKNLTWSQYTTLSNTIRISKTSLMPNFSYQNYRWLYFSFRQKWNCWHLISWPIHGLWSCKPWQFTTKTFNVWSTCPRVLSSARLYFWSTSMIYH